MTNSAAMSDESHRDGCEEEWRPETVKQRVARLERERNARPITPLDYKRPRPYKTRPTSATTAADDDHAAPPPAQDDELGGGAAADNPYVKYNRYKKDRSLESLSSMRGAGVDGRMFNDIAGCSEAFRRADASDAKGKKQKPGPIRRLLSKLKRN
eukprot:Selendium_serpulae@DN4196_c0_g1_i2.p1